MNNYVSEAEILKKHKVDRKTLYRWRLAGKLPFQRLGRAIGYLEKDVKKLLK